MKYAELKKAVNDKALPLYKETISKIEALYEEIKSCEGQYKELLQLTAERILAADKFLNEFNDDYYTKYSIEELKKINIDKYSEIAPENYETSYANPDYCVKQFGDKIGQLLSTTYIFYRSYFNFAQNKDINAMAKGNQYFINLVESMKADKKDFETLRNIYREYSLTGTVEERELGLRDVFDTDSPGYSKIVLDSDLSDLRYLYQYGKFITDNEIKTAEFLNNYPAEKIEKLVTELSKAYIRGFELAKKDYKKKNSYLVVYNVGQERIVRELVKKLKAFGLNPLFSRATSTQINKQYGYDHKFDYSLAFDEEIAAKNIDNYRQAAVKCEDILRAYSGVVAFDSFGEKPFSPKSKESNLKASPEQQKLQQKASIETSQISQQYMPRTENSFCIIGFPVPEIGEQFEEIFEATSEINMIDTIHWEKIQQKILDVLDLADYVHVKGKNQNRTDIKVKMQKLEDPTKHTNFVNCGADVNIPVGELFTSPQLEDTNGVLHVPEVFLHNITFKNLELKFKDGYVEDYTCDNMEDKEEAKKLVQETLMFPHKTLPLGEFAIGTNTPAYIMAKKFDILNLLPILIVEKMGPHFAIGDTCFSWEEDFAVFNPIDGKEITARENSHSAKRKTNIQEAYTNCHTDITLPYEDLDFISVITHDGKEIDILRDGKFAVPGTEELNKPLEDWGI